MNTNIALVGADPLATNINRLNNVVVDPARLMDQARKGYNKDDDIEEDENDRFISSRKGKLRPRFETGTEDWAEEVRPTGMVLSRPKRSKDADVDERREKIHKHHKHSKDPKRDRSERKSREAIKRDRKDRVRYRMRGDHSPVTEEYLPEFTDSGRKKIDNRGRVSYIEQPHRIYVISNGEEANFEGKPKGGKKSIRIKSKHRLSNSLQPKQKSDVAKEQSDKDAEEGSGEVDKKSEKRLNETSEDSKDSKKTEASSEHEHPTEVRVLSRQKRCGGGRRRDDDDDDGDANRSRRARRARRRAARRARKRAQKAVKNSTTTTTRRVIQDGQVVSQDGTAQTSCAQQQVAPQPIILQQPAPAVLQNVVPGQQIVQPAQPIVQGAAPAQPIVQAPAAPAPAVAAQGSLQGSVQQGASVEGTMKISA